MTKRRVDGQCTAGRRGRRARRLTLEPLEPRALLAILGVGPTSPYATLQAAVDHARSGDVILIASGTYAESVDLSRMGSAVDASPGNLTIRGESAADVVLSSAAGPAVFNSAAWAGNLTCAQVTIQSPAGAGLEFDHFQGRLEVLDAVFQNLAGTAVELAELDGQLQIENSAFLNVGQGQDHAAIRLTGLDGRGAISGNTFQDAAGTAIVFQNGGTHEASLLVNDNLISGEGAFFSTTKAGVQARLADTTRTDLTLDNNQFDGLAAGAVAVAAEDQARLQTRWSWNAISNTAGEPALRLQTAGNAVAAVALLANSVTDAWDDGLEITVQDTATLTAVLRDNALVNIGDGVQDDGLTIAAAGAGTVHVQMSGNDFATVSGLGVHLLATGQAMLWAAVEANVLNELNVLSGESAVLVEQGAADDQAVIQLRLANNTVLGAMHDAYTLQQRGSGTFRLEGSGGDATAAVAADNLGGPVVVAGTVAVVAPGTFSGDRPALLGGRVWHDQDGDGQQGDSEPGRAAVAVSLAGTGSLLVNETLTDSSGSFQFVGLPAGDYGLTIGVPAGFALAPADQGTDDTRDSDFDRATRQAAVSLAAGQDDLSLGGGLWSTWQNPRHPEDVNGDGFVTALDALLVINDLNANAARALPIPPVTAPLPPPYVDVDGDGTVAPLDVLYVINYLNGASATEAGEGEAGLMKMSRVSGAVSFPGDTSPFGRGLALRPGRGEMVAEFQGN